MRFLLLSLGLLMIVLTVSSIYLLSDEPARADEDPAVQKRARAEFQACIEKHASALVKLAKRWRKKNPAVAIRALQRAFDLQPGYPAARKVAEQMGFPDLERTVILFDGSGLAAWRDAALPTWSMDGVCFRGDAPKHAYLTLSYERFEGNYTVRMEARVAEEYEGPSYFALGGDANDEYCRVEVGLNGGLINVTRKLGKDVPSEPLYTTNPANLRPPLKPTDWARYELRFAGDEVGVYFNGRHLIDVPRAGATGGYVTLVAQHVAFLVRRLEVVKR